MYSSSKRRQEKRERRPIPRGVTITVIVILMLLAGGLWTATYFKFAEHNKPLPVAVKNTAVTTPKPKLPTITEAKGHYLFNGTIFWGRAIERDARKANDLGRALGNLSTFNRQDYDAWIADLECPVVNMTVPYQQQVDRLNFNCPPDFAPYYTKYFNIINLANNHTFDQGRSSFPETQQHLTDAGAQVFGSYDIDDDANRCEVISLPLKLEKSDNTTENAALPVAFCAYHSLVHMPTAAEVAEVTKYSKIMPVIAFAHMGIEYTAKATSAQKTVGHELIDAGADFVIMNHPHWVQNTEAYKGKLIVYSTGNFIFDQLDSETLRSASIDTTMTAAYDDNLAAWIKLGTDCKASTLHDTCFAAAEAAGLKKPAVSYKFSVVAGDELSPRWIPKKAGSAVQQAVENRMNWSQTVQNLHYQ